MAPYASPSCWDQYNAVVRVKPYAPTFSSAPLPAQPLLSKVAPGRHDLGGDPALRRRGHLRAEGLQRQGDLVVLCHRQGVVHAAPVAGDQRLARLGDRGERVPAEDRRRAGQHEEVPLAPTDDALVARELVALQLTEHTGAVLTGEQSADGHQVRVGLHQAEGGLQEVRSDRRVGIHDQVHVLDRAAGQGSARAWLSPPAFALGVADRLEHLHTARQGDLHGRVGAVVGDHEDPVRRARRLSSESIDAPMIAASS